MSHPHWVLTDVEKRIHLPEFHVAAQGAPHSPEAARWFPGNSNWSIQKTRLQGGVSDGVEVLTVNNGALEFSLLPTRGMGVWRGQYGDLPIGWNSPAAMPVHPAFVNQNDRGGLGWLSGFNELLCRCGLESNGPPGIDLIPNNQGNPTEMQVTLHGKIANIPAHYVDVSVTPGEKGKICVTGIVDEALLFGPRLRLKATYETVPGSNSFVLIDEVTNLRGVPAELELLYHTNVGGPFLEKDARVVAPVMEMAPRDGRAGADIATWETYLGPTPGYSEQVYFFDLAASKSGDTVVLLRNAHGEKGVSLRFNKANLPHFTLWKNTQAEADGYVTGLEPGTNFPNLKTYERQQGRVIVLQPGQSYTTRLEFHVHSTAAQVAAVEAEIKDLQDRVQTRIHPNPQRKFTPVG